jgi:hypothetical protein
MAVSSVDLFNLFDNPDSSGLRPDHGDPAADRSYDRLA